MIYNLLNLKNASLASSIIQPNSKGLSINKSLVFLLIAFFFNNGIHAQNSLNSGDFSGGSWGSGQSMGASAGSSLIITKTVGTAGDKYFRFFGDGSPCGEYQPASNGTFFTNGTTTAVGSSCGNSFAWRINVPNATDNVIFKTDGSNAGGNAVVFVIGGTAVSVSSVSNPGGVNGLASTVTATLSGNLVTGQGVYLRYSNDNFSSSSVVQMTGSGTSYSANIPAGTNTAGLTVRYYVFTSGTAVAPASNGSDSDLRTINFNNNAGSNYSYTVQNLTFTANSGNLWSTAANWNTGVTPSTSANLGTVIINGNCTMDQNATVGALTINDTRTLTINSGSTLQVGGAITRGGANNGAIVVNGTLQMNSGYSTTFSPSYSATTSKLIYNTGVNPQTRGLEWTSALQPFDVQISNNTTMDADNVGGSGSQAATLLGNLTIDSGSSFYMDFGGGNATLTIGRDVTINGNISISNTTTLGGNWSRSGSIFSIANSAKVVFNNSSTAQTITRTGGETFSGLEINKTYSATNKLTLASNVTVNGALTFTAGVINTGANKLTLGTSGSIAGTPSNTSHVQGNFERIVAAANNPTVTFQVGDGAIYAPVSIAINGNITNSTGTLQVSTLGSNHPNFATTGLSQSKYVQRNWTIANNVALTGLVTYAPTFTFVSGDLIGSPTTANLLVGRFNTSWSLPTVGTRTATTTQATGLTAFGDFQIAECSAPNVSNFSTTSATAACVGSPSTVSVSSSSLGNGSFTVTYDLSAPNAATGLTATLTMSGGTGTFVTGNIANSGGSTTVTIQKITVSGCESTLSSGNTTSFSTTVLPNVSNFSTPSASAICGGSGSTVTINSSSLAAATYTVTYNLSGSTTATGSTASMVFTGGSGTFTTSNLNAGSTAITITNLSNQATACSSAVSSGNTVNASVSANSAAPKYVVHVASSTTATYNACSGSGNFWGANPSVGRNLVIQWNIEEQLQWSNTGIYYTTDGSTPSGTRGVGAGTTQFVSGAYICTNAGRDIATGTIPLSANTAGTTVKYIIGAWNGACGTEGFANNVFGAQFNTTPVVYSYTLIDPNVANFRSKATGNWTDITKWEYESVTGLWADATQAPGATGNNNVNIQAAHTITLNTATSVVSGKTVTVSGILTTGTNVISGAGAVLIDSASAIARINGAQTYTGNTTIQNGELWIESNAGSIASTNAVAVGAVGAANVTKLWLTNATGGTTFANNITVAAGNSDTRVVGGLNTSGTNTFSGTINDLSSNFNLYAAGSGINEFTGNINTNGNPIIINQEGVNIGTGTVRLSGTNTNTGGTTLRAGTLSVPTNASLGTGVVTIGNAAISGTLAITDDTSRSTNIAVTTGSTNAAIDVATTKTFTLTGQLTGGTNTTKIGKSGLGTLTVSGSSTYAGQTQVGAGTVIVGNNAGLGTNASTTERGIDLGLNIGDVSTSNNVSILANTGITVPQSIYVAPNTGSATRTIGLNGSGSATYNNEIFLGGNLTISGGTGTTTISGAIVNTSGVIVSQGTVIYSGANTYTGSTVVNSGATLRISAANRISDSSNLVLDGGTFSTGITGSSDTLGTLNVTGSSVIALGSGSHTLTFANSNALTWTGGTLNITGWTGTGGPSGSGTAGKIIITGSGLTQSQLNKISFGGVLGATFNTTTGELVPKGTPTISVSGTQTFTYNGTAQGPATVTTSSSATPTLLYTNVGGNSYSSNTAPTNAGNYEVVASVAENNDYFAASSTPAYTFTINKKSINVTAVTDAKTYDGNISSDGVPTYTLESGDTTTTAPTQTFDNKNVGSGNKVLTPSGLVINDGNSGNNYVITYVPVGNGTISAKSLTASLTATVISKVYDGNDTATLSTANYSLSGGIVSGETVTITNTSGTYINKNQGTGKLVTVESLLLGGADASNYVLSNPTSISRNVGTISRVSLTASLTGIIEKEYNGNTNATLTSANYDLSGIIGSEDVIVTDTAGLYDTKNVGTAKTVTVTSLGLGVQMRLIIL
ncbi:YDG domain-containing protein [Flavobacterium myungsuense]|uniref:YDG domain-containing protein n=1 Tax=Flavobacterium myungsuense TaxID=651823 RepID=UPI00363AB557